MEEKNKIYIGNLEFSVTEEDIRKKLGEKGLNAVDVKVITDRYTGRSRGFGFAEFDTDEAVENAINHLNGQDLKGRALKVSRAQKMKPRKDDFGGGKFKRTREY